MKKGRCVLTMMKESFPLQYKEGELFEHIHDIIMVYI